MHSIFKQVSGETMPHLPKNNLLMRQDSDFDTNDLQYPVDGKSIRFRETEYSLEIFVML